MLLWTTRGGSVSWQPLMSPACQGLIPEHATIPTCVGLSSHVHGLSFLLYFVGFIFPLVWAPFDTKKRQKKEEEGVFLFKTLIIKWTICAWHFTRVIQFVYLCIRISIFLSMQKLNYCTCVFFRNKDRNQIKHQYIHS